MRKPELLEELYKELYSSVAATANGSAAERLLHRSMEARFGADLQFARVLELGGNRGEHVSYVRHQFDQYVVSDLRPPELDDAVRGDPRVKPAVFDAAAIASPNNSFDRVISTCLLHHVESPLEVAAEMRRVCRPGGTITLLVPTDPGLAYRLAQWLTSGRNARKAGMGRRWKLLHAVDHPNHFRSIRTQLRFVFATDRVTVLWWPTRIGSMALNLFTVWHVEIGKEAARSVTSASGDGPSLTGGPDRLRPTQ